MNTPEIFHRRLQAFLRRYDRLVNAVGPLKAPQPNDVAREVAGLLLLSGQQCCVAAAIMDTAENIAITVPNPATAVRVRMHDPLAHVSRRGKMVVVPGVGKDTFPFPDVDSLAMIFEPSIVSRFADCGVMVLDSPTDVISAALKYLLLDPDSKKPEDLAKAAELIKGVRPYIRKFHSSEYINALAGGNICLAFGYSGDILQARDRAAKAVDKRTIAYAVPAQGAMLWIDVAAIPRDSPNPDNALRFLDFMLEPKVAAASSELTGYANANVPGTALLDKAISGNPSIYPKNDDRAKFYTITAGTPEQTRERTRLWTSIKTGQ